jgi:hypothetical protein
VSIPYTNVQAPCNSVIKGYTTWSNASTNRLWGNFGLTGLTPRDPTSGPHLVRCPATLACKIGPSCRIWSSPGTAAAIGVGGTVIVGIAGFWANVRNTNKTTALTLQGQVTDRYSKVIEQLGSEKLDVRIGGIYALERIARDSARDHPTIMEVLTAFIRESSRELPCRQLMKTQVLTRPGAGRARTCKRRHCHWTPGSHVRPRGLHGRKAAGRNDMAAIRSGPHRREPR